MLYWGVTGAVSVNSQRQPIGLALPMTVHLALGLFHWECIFGVPGRMASCQSGVQGSTRQPESCGWGSWLLWCLCLEMEGFRVDFWSLRCDITKVLKTKYNISTFHCLDHQFAQENLQHWWVLKILAIPSVWAHVCEPRCTQGIFFKVWCLLSTYHEDFLCSCRVHPVHELKAGKLRLTPDKLALSSSFAVLNIS